MIGFLFDEDFHGPTIRAFRRQRGKQTQTITAREAGLAEHPDEFLLDFAITRGLALATRDAKTMLRAAQARIAAGLPMSGIVVVARRATIPTLVFDLTLIAETESIDSMHHRIIHIPI